MLFLTILLILSVNLSNCIKWDECDGVQYVTGQNGTITNPAFPNPYNSNRECEWQITVEKSHRIRINITTFSIEDSRFYDRVIVKELGANKTVANAGSAFYRVAVIYRSNSQVVLKPEGHRARIVWETDEGDHGSGEMFGFKAQWQAVDDAEYDWRACNESVFHLTGENGTLTNPEFPDPYNPNIRCSWRISVEPKQILIINMITYAMDSKGSDFFAVSELDGRGRHRLVGKLTEQFSEKTVSTTSNNAFVRWNTSRFNNGVGSIYGFRLQWQAVHFDWSACDGSEVNLYGSRGTLTNPEYPHHYQPNKRCDWHVTVKVGKLMRISITTYALDGRGNDYVDVGYGSNNSISLLIRVAKANWHSVVTVPGNDAYIRWKSDYYNSGLGEIHGFKVEWQEVNLDWIACIRDPVELNGVAGTILSPQYPWKMECKWQIQVAKSKKIRLEVIAFPSITPNNDFLQIFSSDSQMQQRHLLAEIGVPLRLDNAVTMVTTPNNIADIVWKKDTERTEAAGGFKIKWQEVNSCERCCVKLAGIWPFLITIAALEIILPIGI